MKRTASIATVFVAAVLIGGGGYSALATGGTDRHGGGPEDRPSVTASTTPAPSPSAVSLTAAQAAATARKAYPGTVVGVELDGDHPGYWEVHIVGADHVRREVRVDSRTGAVTLDRRGGDDGPGDDHGVRTGADDHGVHTGGDDRVGHDAGDDRGRGTHGQDDAAGDDHGGATGGDDRPGDDHGVHAGGDDHLDGGDDHGGDDHAGDDSGRGRHRGGHGGDDH
ncbi:PepSY domain-containing protein [Streptomyces sp. NPDC127066]|uniref:PepSY domain-containing protein n=1 Tax=Streptomyces sp. NPDC127066 TaxID=3347125 RepID=UPI0036531A34